MNDPDEIKPEDRLITEDTLHDIGVRNDTGEDLVTSPMFSTSIAQALPAKEGGEKPDRVAPTANDEKTIQSVGAPPNITPEFSGTGACELVQICSRTTEEHFTGLTKSPVVTQPETKKVYAVKTVKNIKVEEPDQDSKAIVCNNDVGASKMSSYAKTVTGGKIQLVASSSRADVESRVDSPTETGTKMASSAVGETASPLAEAMITHGGSTEEIKLETDIDMDSRSEPRDDSAGVRLSDRKKARKKAPHPTRRVLYAKKEREAAMKLLSDHHDLVDYLPLNDCHFLAERLWIFTPSQLANLIDARNSHECQSDDPHKARDLREDLINELAKKYFIESNPDYSQNRREVGERSRCSESQEDPAQDIAMRHDSPRYSESNEAVRPPDKGNSDLTSSTLAGASGRHEQPNTNEVVTELDELSCKSRNPFNMPVCQTMQTKEICSVLLNTETTDSKTVIRKTSMAGDERMVGIPNWTDFLEPQQEFVDIPIVDKFVERAEITLEEWSRSLKSGIKSNSTEKRFRLEGPISSLLPNATLNFLRTAGVQTVFELLSLRRTETGAICDMLRVWRDMCGLPELNHLALAKHLLGVSWRLETAITSILPIDRITRRWMNDPIIVMTGAAREFLVDFLEILFARQFLAARTKELSEKLVEWRVKKGLIPLKGSGKVAMISGWKACVREEIDVQSEDGKYLQDVDLEAISAQGTPIVRDETNGNTRPISKEPDAKKPKQSIQSGISVEYATHSQVFLEHVLGESTARFLSTLNINTTAELETAKTGAESRLYQRILETKRASSLSGCQKRVEEWRTKLQERLKGISKGTRRENVKEAKERVEIVKVRTSFDHKQPRSASKAVPQNANLSDPFDTLSLSTRAFLTSIGITTGEQFLSTRTTDIAVEFVKWRVQEGKPELKGLGSIASVSGWKAACRKAASDMGLASIAALEPDSKTTWTTTTKSKPEMSMESPAALVVPSLPLHEESFISNENIMSGRGRIEIAVRSVEANLGHFSFEVSLRAPSSDSTPAMFVTYKGFSPCEKLLKPSGTSEIVLISCIGDPFPKRLPILSDAPLSKVSSTANLSANFDNRAPFSSTATGCGLVELGIYGVIPFQDQDLDEMKEALRCFVLEEEINHELHERCSDDNPFNVLIHRSIDGTCKYLLYVGTYLEKGQTLPLCFPSIATMLNKYRYQGSSMATRLVVDDALGAISQDDLRRILKWMKYDLRKLTSDMNWMENSSDNAIRIAIGQRRRLHWLVRRVIVLLKTVSDEDKQIVQSLEFGFTQFSEWTACFRGNASVESIFADHVRLDLLACVANDPLCSSRALSSCLPVARNFFNELTDILSGCSHELVDSPESLAEKLTGMIRSSMRIDKDTELDKLMICDAAELIQIEEVSGIACEDVLGMGVRKIYFKPINEVSVERTEVSYRWYRELLLEISFIAIAAFECILDSTSQEKFKQVDAMASMRKAALETDESLEVRGKLAEFSRIVKIRIGAESLGKGGSGKCIPSSYQFFLEIVWPALRDHGWRLEAGELAYHVTFIPPRSGRRKRAALVKHESMKKRLRLIREVDKIGWGAVRKLTQRLVVAVSSDVEADTTTSKSVSEAISQLYQWIMKDIGDEDASIIARAKSIIDAVRVCFDNMAPFIADEAGWIAIPNTDGAPSYRYGAETLLRLALVLPTIMRHSSLALQDINDSLQVVQDVADVFTADYRVLLDRRFHPSNEQYIDESLPQKSSLAARLKMMKSSVDAKDGKKGNMLEMKECVLDEDKVGPDGERRMTDFVAIVMGQIVPCRASDRDTEKKYRRVHVGYPGLTCRHCVGSDGEGRYFFSTLESLTTASTVLEKHLLKCPHVPSSIKSAITHARTTHTAQRKALETGSQQAYFNRLWDRLRSSSIGGEVANSPSMLHRRTEGEETKNSEAQEPDNEEMEFRDHTVLLDFVRSTAPWKNNRSVANSLNKYYSCLDYGGRIYQTPSMPKRFSSEWLLAKVVPRRQNIMKNKNLPG